MGRSRRGSESVFQRTYRDARGRNRKTKNWYIEFVVGNRTIREATDFTNRTDAHLQHHEHVEDAERHRDHYEKIARQHCARVIPHEGAPELGPRPIAWRGILRRVAPYRSRRYMDASFTRSSEAIRFSPHVRFADAISAIRCRRSAGNRGRPRGCDFHRHNS